MNGSEGLCFDSSLRLCGHGELGKAIGVIKNSMDKKVGNLGS